MKKTALAVALALSGHAYAETYYTRPLSACEHNGDGLAYECAASPGAAGAWRESGGVTYGSTGTTFGRGDSMYICGQQSAGYSVGSVGVFDGTADSVSDIITFRFDCPNDPGSVTNIASGNGLLGSGRPGMRVIGVKSHVEFRNVSGNGVAQYLGSTTTCDSANGFRCFHTSDIDCERVGESGNGHCVVTTSSAFGNFPPTPTTGVLIEMTESNEAGGGACNVSGHYRGAIIDGCRSIRDGVVQDTWGVYQRAEARNIGACGAGMTWSRLGVSNVHKTSVPTSCIPSGLTWQRLQHLVGATGANINPEYVKNGACTGDATCEANLLQGQWNHVGNDLYINRGTSTISATASVNITLAPNDGSIIRNSYAEGFGPAHDGVGIGFDLGATNGRIEYSESKDNAGPGFSFNLATGLVTASIAENNGDSNFNLNHMGRAANVTSIQPVGQRAHFRYRTHFGHTVSVENALMVGGQYAGVDTWKDGGTIEWKNNAYQPGVGFQAWLGSPQVEVPAMTGGIDDIITDDPMLSGGPGIRRWQPRMESLLCGAGKPRAGTYYNGARIGLKPDIGALPCESWR